MLECVGDERRSLRTQGRSDVGSGWGLQNTRHMIRFDKKFEKIEGNMALFFSFKSLFENAKPNQKKKNGGVWWEWEERVKKKYRHS